MTIFQLHAARTQVLLQRDAKLEALRRSGRPYLDEARRIRMDADDALAKLDRQYMLVRKA